MDDYTAFFYRATGREPYPYQLRLATGDSLPALLAAPTGTGKTAAAVLAWLWRRRYAGDKVGSRTPRRLVYCLPMRVLAEQTLAATRGWLKRLELPVVDWAASRDAVDFDPAAVGLGLLMGGQPLADWDLAPEADAILIGTQDMLLSRALNRGYGMSRYRWPLPFAWLNNDVLWVYDEVQLMGDALATSTQLAGLRRELGTYGRAHELWMSATLRKDWLLSYDLLPFADSLAEQTLTAADEAQPGLACRLQAGKSLRRLSSQTPRELARTVLERHERGQLTLVVVNTVSRANELYTQLAKLSARSGGAKVEPSVPDLLLLHSQFRLPERRTGMERLLSEVPPEGRIVVATQVVEAGVDISAATLVTELAPWDSLVQRLGRCNRYGELEAAEALIVDIATGAPRQALPYEATELDLSRRVLDILGEGASVGPTALATALAQPELADLARNILRYRPNHVLRRRDMVELFDTTPDLAGNDIDVARFIRQTQEADAYVFWRPFDGNTSALSAPQRDELCPVPVGSLRDFLRKREGTRKGTLLVWDQLQPTADASQGDWVRVNAAAVRPGETYLLDAAAGGYRVDLGWSPESRAPVPVAPNPASKDRPDADGVDVFTRGSWQSIAEHTDAVVAEAGELIDRLGLRMTAPREAAAVLTAARWHDRGKAHRVFQDALGDTPSGAVQWAKSPTGSGLSYARRGFRHELAGALAARAAGLPVLAWYLIAAHHGKVRLVLRALPEEHAPGEPGVRFARGIWEGDTLPETPLGGSVVAPPSTLDLACLEIGLDEDDKRSWIDEVLELRDDDPCLFRLAFLEGLLRVADMRASQLAANERSLSHSGEAERGGEKP